MAQDVPLTEGLGRRAGWRLIDDFEALTDDQHTLGELAASSGALVAEIPTVALLPEGQGPVAFTLDGRELCSDLTERNDFNREGFDDAQRLA